MAGKTIPKWVPPAFEIENYEKERHTEKERPVLRLPLIPFFPELPEKKPVVYEIEL